MRALWQRCAGGALTEADVLAEVQALGGAALADTLAGWVHGHADLPLEAALAAAGIAVEHEPSPFSAALGLKLSEGAFTGVQIRSVLTGSAAAQAGLSAGDELLAVNGWRIRRLDDATQWIATQQPFELLLARQQQLRSLTVRPNGDAVLGQQVKLSPQTQPAVAAASLRKAWLGR
jgi:predicted metalloprotease with PDZ domain